MCAQINATTIKSNFSVIPNHLIRSSELSGVAFKLLCIGLSHNDNWVFRKSQILTCMKEGDHALSSAMKELKDAGYLYTKARKLDTGQMSGHHWFWFENPVTEEEFKEFFRNSGFPAFGKSGARESGAPEKGVVLRRQSSKKTKDKKTNTKLSVRGEAAGSSDHGNQEERPGKCHKTMRDGTTECIEISHVISRCLRERPKLPIQAINAAWETFYAYDGVIGDWWALFCGIVDKQEKNRKSQQASKRCNTEDKGTSSPEQETTKPNIELHPWPNGGKPLTKQELERTFGQYRT